jgi:tight adherence protein B
MPIFETIADKISDFVSAGGIINAIVTVMVFGLVFSIWCICVFLWLGQYLMRIKTVQKRLGILKKESDESRTLHLWREVQKDAGNIIAYSSSLKITLKEYLENLQYDAGWNISAQKVIIRLIAIVIFAFLSTYSAGGSIILALGIATGIIVVFLAYTEKRINTRAALFERQLVDALGVAARALRAGHPLGGAFQLVAEEIGEPLKGVFFRICQEQYLGLDLKDSIREVAKTTHNAEFKLFATAVAIQLQSGGNLADLMDSLAAVIRARMRLNRRVRVITAQTKLSQRILIALPVILFFALNFLSPKYMETFYKTSIGNFLLVAMVVSILLGSWMMKRISVLRF